MFPLYQDCKVYTCSAVVLMPASDDKWCIQPLFRHASFTDPAAEVNGLADRIWNRSGTVLTRKVNCNKRCSYNCYLIGLQGCSTRFQLWTQSRRMSTFAHNDLAVWSLRLAKSTAEAKVPVLLWPKKWRGDEKLNWKLFCFMHIFNDQTLAVFHNRRTLKLNPESLDHRLIHQMKNHILNRHHCRSRTVAQCITALSSCITDVHSYSKRRSSSLSSASKLAGSCSPAALLNSCSFSFFSFIIFFFSWIFFNLRVNNSNYL